VIEPSWLRATRQSYDTVAVDYANLLNGELAAKPVDRAVLALFAELVQAAGGGSVADLGCGPRSRDGTPRVTGPLRACVDLSPGMVAVARRSHPGLRYDVGSMSSLDIAEGVLAGALAWYSVFHTPTEALPELFAEFRRVLRVGGQLLLAFQAGDEPVHLEQAYGHPVSLVVHRRSPDRVADLLVSAGLVVHARVLRKPDRGERSPQAYLLARKPAGAAIA
jgi:SAM-dependent methyltransferase